MRIKENKERKEKVIHRKQFDSETECPYNIDIKQIFREVSKIRIECKSYYIKSITKIILNT
jgi:hypothetical protein